ICLAFFYMTMNLVRQGFVLIITLYAIEYIKKRNLCAFIIAMLMAVCIHKSALILVPFYLLANVKFDWKIISFYIAGGLTFFAFSVPMIAFIQKFIYSSPDYHPVTGYYMKPLSMMYSIYPIVLLVVVMVFSGILIKANPTNRVIVNLCAVALIAYLFLTTKHFIMQRISDYFLVAIILALPQIADALRVTPQEKECIQEQKLRVAQCVKEKKDASTQKETLSFLKRKQEDKAYYFNITIGFFIVSFVLIQLFISWKNYHNVFPYQSLWGNNEESNIQGQLIPE
ncbi:MAG: EpsG family protein, partial [Oscillospiraceae bacterium]